MYIYKNYCYETIAEIGDQFLSDPLAVDGHYIEGVRLPAANPDRVKIDLVNVSDSTTLTINHDPPLCTALGFQNSYTGLTLEDSQVLLTGSLLIFVAAFVITSIRRAL